LAIPADWEEIPADELELFMLGLAEATGGRSAEIYQHGFQPAGLNHWFSYPHILIQVKEMGRLRYGQFLDLPGLDEMNEFSLERFAERRGKTGSSLDVRQAFFDLGTYSLRLFSTIQTEAGSLVEVRSASFLTEKGLFVIHCYELSSRIEESGPVFDAVFASVAFDESLAYKPRLRDRFQLRPAYLVLAGLISSVVVMLFLARRQRSEGSPKENIGKKECR
jgi:hypothetical protein